MPTSRESALLAALRAEGVRITRQRAALLRVIAAASDHPDANEIHRRVHLIDKSTPLLTVHLTMAIPDRRGAVQGQDFQGTPARLETADAKHHDRFVGIDTGAVGRPAAWGVSRCRAPWPAG